MFVNKTWIPTPNIPCLMMPPASQGPWGDLELTKWRTIMSLVLQKVKLKTEDFKENKHNWYINHTGITSVWKTRWCAITFLLVIDIQIRAAYKFHGFIVLLKSSQFPWRGSYPRNFLLYNPYIRDSISCRAGTMKDQTSCQLIFQGNWEKLHE